jgi:PAS domain S-box-containing protein
LSPTPPEPSDVGHANAEELGAILDTTAEGIVMFDAEGNLNSCNRSAEALFGYDGETLVQRNLADLFAPESQAWRVRIPRGIKAPASPACSTTAARCWRAKARAASSRCR